LHGDRLLLTKLVTTLFLLDALGHTQQSSQPAKLLSTAAVAAAAAAAVAAHCCYAPIQEALGARVDELEALLGEAQRAGAAKQPLVDAEDEDMPDNFDGDLDDLFEDTSKQRRGRGSKARAERGKAGGAAAQGRRPG
jgi:hypothetical protein